MIKFIKNSQFYKCEDGAVTVDWVVLTAAVVGLAVAGVGTLNNSVNVVGGKVQVALSTKSVDNGDP